MRSRPVMFCERNRVTASRMEQGGSVAARAVNPSVFVCCDHTTNRLNHQPACLRIKLAGVENAVNLRDIVKYLDTSIEFQQL